MGKKVIIAGATGMVGGHLLEFCLGSDQVDEVISIVRRPSEQQHEKLQELIVADLTDYTPDETTFSNVDAAYFCIGVYTGAVSREMFRKITVDIPVAFAKSLHQYSPEARFCLLSGQGADRTEKSRIAFAKDKGAAENQLSAMGFKAFHTFRPGYIYPVVPRDEPNLSYRISRFLYPVIRLFGENASIKSTELADGMFRVGIGEAEAAEVLENRDILQVLK
ncbi:MAG: NAD-dependent epimerase/dehydratase family protein [Bacteroidota bacterium]